MISRLIYWIKTKNFLNAETNLPDAFNQKLKALEPLLGYKIKNKNYFIRALTHRSYLDVLPQIKKSNERLEFLGDVVLGLIVSDFLFKNFPEEEEGFLTKSRAAVVSKSALSESVSLLNLENLIFYNTKYLSSLSKKGLTNISVDALEALIAAIYLDAGLKKTKNFVYRWIINPKFKSGAIKKDLNYKGQLLEYAHAEKMGVPFYSLINEEGPEHSKTFTVKVLIDNIGYGSASGKNKKNAEQKAAKLTLQQLQNDHQ